MNLNEEIAKVAYELYERDGRQNGKDREHWLEAEGIVRARRAEPSKTESGRATAPRVKTPAAKEAPAAAKEKQKAPKPGAAVASSTGKKSTPTPRSK
jgi:hypothetical protein